MKHIFVVNPCAGKGKAVACVKEMVEKSPEDCEIYVTKAPGDTEAYVRRRCLEPHSETLRFYACGGDGTIKDVAEGIHGQENAEMSAVPMGSGNDYVKYYGGAENFLDINRLKNAKAVPVDLIRINDEYCINVCNFGFDSVVADTIDRVRDNKLLNGKRAYTYGVVKALFGGMKNHAEIYADGERIDFDGTFLLCTAANGQYVGGSFKCAPRSENNDGQMEVSVVRPVSRLTFIRLVKAYRDGTYLDDPRFKKLVRYRRVSELKVVSDGSFRLSLDGEMRDAPVFRCTVEKGAVMFAAPDADAEAAVSPVPDMAAAR